MNPVPSRVYSSPEYLRVPYADKGRDPNGWDCYGMYRWVFKEAFGVLVPSYSELYLQDGTPGRDASVGAALVACSQRWRTGDHSEGDAIVFKLAGVPLHCGYVIERGIMLHCLAGRNTAIERYDTAAWSKRIEGVYRWK